MGCCKCISTNLSIGFTMPNQEEEISRSERGHPFERVEIGELLKEMRSHSKSMSDWQFYACCHKLGIPSEELEKSSFSLYLSKLRMKNGLIDLRSLFVSCILLASCNWHTKLTYLLELYKEGDWVTETQIENMISGMVYVSTQVHPSMSLVRLSPDAINHYISKIKHAESYVLASVLREIRSAFPVSSEALISTFSKKPHIQKIFWASGIRIMLIEGDIHAHKMQRRKIDEFIETDHCSPRGGNTEENEGYFSSRDTGVNN